MSGMGGSGDVPGGGIDRARFLKLAGLGAGLSLFPGSLFLSGKGLAQAVGGADLLDPDGPYPIAAWWPPPPVPNTNPAPEAETARRYEELAGANFNAAIGGNGVGNDRANRLALDACEANGLRLVLADSRLSNAIKGISSDQGSAQAEAQEEPDGVLQALTEQDSQQDIRAQAAADRATVTQRLEELNAEFGQRRGLAGIFLYDEPGRTLFSDLRFARQEVGRIFGPDELPYVNVWPSYASPKNALEAKSYTDYLGFYMDETRYPDSAVAPPFLDFDHYPLLVDERTTADFFYNHAVIRNFSKRFGVPSWGFVQSMGFDGRTVGLGKRRRPDEAEIFWQINVALAYGVKGVQYFTYWTPENGAVRFGNALITRAGARTPLYNYAQRANGYLERIGGVLLPLTSVSVTHANEPNPPRGAQPFRANLYIRATSGSPVVLGLFTRPGAPAERYLLVANRTPNKSAKAHLTVSDAVRTVEAFDPSAGTSGAFVRVNLASGSPRYLYPTMSPGRARLYRLRS